jgi:hypothetical protein
MAATEEAEGDVGDGSAKEAVPAEPAAAAAPALVEAASDEEVIPDCFGEEPEVPEEVLRALAVTSVSNLRALLRVGPLAVSRLPAQAWCLGVVATGPHLSRGHAVGGAVGSPVGVGC